MASKYENETIITFNEEEPTAVIYSCSKPWMNKIMKIKGWKQCGHGVEADVSKDWIKFPKAPAKRNFSDKTKAELKKRLAKARTKTS